MEDSERDAIKTMIDMAVFAEMSAARLMDMPWVADGISDDEINMLERLTWIDYAGYAAISERLLGLEWLVDGVSEDENTAISHIESIILRGAPGSAARLIDMPFLQAIEHADVRALDTLSAIASRSPDYLSYILASPLFKGGITNDQTVIVAALARDLADAIDALDGVADGLDGYERGALEAMTNIAGIFETSAWLLLTMPFLQTIEHADVVALDSLSYLFQEGLGAVDFNDLLAHPLFKDGITDDQTMKVAMLHKVLEYAPHRVDALLDPSATTVERRMVELPLSGEVELAIVRPYRIQGTRQSMDLLENAVREAEKLMDAPLPYGRNNSRNAVWLLFENSVPIWAGGQHQRTNIAIRPQYDSDDDSYAHLIAHEVAHYYWTHGFSWIKEGMAEVMASVIERERVGSPVKATRAPCGVVKNIMELEALACEGGERGFDCNYSLGEGLFLDLLQHLGEDAFWEGARNLYAESLDGIYAGIYGNNVRLTGIEDVRQAFGPEADAIISRWYGE